jgi:hypothetical protein
LDYLDFLEGAELSQHDSTAAATNSNRGSIKLLSVLIHWIVMVQDDNDMLPDAETDLALTGTADTEAVKTDNAGH